MKWTSLLVVFLAAVVLVSCRRVAQTATPAPEAVQAPPEDTVTDEMPAEDTQVAPVEEPGAEVLEKGGIREFVVNGKDYKFDPTEIKVNRGDTVRIVFNSQDMMHDWVVDEFGARTKVLTAGKEETIEFVADKSGTFEYYCSVSDHRAKGMVGKLIVN